jgi:predicted RNase H-like HicB family nuclease
VTKYEIVIGWSDEDAVFIAEVPELPGCMAYGETRAEALANAEEAIDLWVEVARKRGREVPQPHAHRLTA